MDPFTGAYRLVCVAGASVPAFVERTSPRSPAASHVPVLPGLRSRPLLSAPPPAFRGSPPGWVLPGLRSRPLLSDRRDRERGMRALVLPGLRSRPLLSGPVAGNPADGAGVLPGLRSRPLLSAAHLCPYAPHRAVLPGLRSRPLLSDHGVHVRSVSGRCCRGFGPGLC